jgi:transposase
MYATTRAAPEGGISHGQKAYSPKLKFQVVLEALTGEKAPGQIAKQYGIHPNSVGLWKKQFLERGAELFSQDDTAREYERRLADLEQLLGREEVEIALQKKVP